MARITIVVWAIVAAVVILFWGIVVWAIFG